MIRRAVLVAAAAVALIIAPSSAMAAPGPNYTAPGYTVTVSDSTPRVNHPIKVSLSGGTAHDRITLTVTPTKTSKGNHGMEVEGNKSPTKQVNAKGDANFSVNFKEAGTYTLTLTDSKGHVVSTQIVTVSAESVGKGAGRGAAEGTAASGLNMGLAVGGGLLVLLLAGAGGVLYTRHRKSAQLPA